MNINKRLIEGSMTQEQKGSGSIHSIDSCANSQLDESKEHVNIDSNSCGRSWERHLTTHITERHFR